MARIIDHNSWQYRKRWEDLARSNRFNGAFFYSKEIIKNIIPLVNTDRSWVTVNTYGDCENHSIVFIHNNIHPENYAWLKDFEDCVLVCGVKTTVRKMNALLPQHKAIYLPLSIDIDDVKKYQCEKTKYTAFVGRPAKKKYGILPSDIDYIENLPRTRLLKELAKYKRVYAVGRCALEAKCLGCEVLPYDRRFPNPDVWVVIDNKEAAKLLQVELNKIDGGKNES